MRVLLSKFTTQQVYYLGKEMGATTHVRKTLDPIWNETIHFPLDTTTQVSYAVLEVWDRDDISANDKLGECRVQFHCSNGKILALNSKISHL